MTTAPFLDRLEEQLLDAAERDVSSTPARRAARRLGPAVPAALAAAAAVAIGVAMLTTGGEDAPVPERRVPASALSGARVYLVNATMRAGLAAATGVQLERLGARVEGLGSVAPRAVSEVRADPADEPAARAIAERLGLPGAVEPLTPELRAQAPGAGVVVLLGRDRETPTRRLPLRGTGGVSGTAILGGAPRALSVTFRGLPAGERYVLWVTGEGQEPTLLGAARFASGRTDGTVTKPLPKDLQSPRRVFLTREPDGTPGPRPTGPVVLDTGPIR